MKKIFSIILIWVLSLALVACGSKENTPSQPASNGSVNSGKNDSGDSSGKKDDNSSNNSNNNNSGNNSSHFLYLPHDIVLFKHGLPPFGKKTDLPLMARQVCIGCQKSSFERSLSKKL